MPLDPSIPLGFRAPAYIDPQRLRREQQEFEQNQQAFEQNQQAQALRQMHLDKLSQDAATDKAYREAMGRGAPVDELMKIDQTRAIAHQRALSEQRKSELEQEKERLALGVSKARRFGELAGSVKDPISLRYNTEQALREGLILPEHAEHVLKTGYTTETIQYLDNAVRQAMTVAERATADQRIIDNELARHAAERAAAEEKRKAEEHAAKMPGVEADTLAKQWQIAAQTIPDAKEAWSAWRAGLAPEIQKQLPPIYSEWHHKWVKRNGLTAAQQVTADQAAANAAETGRHNLQTEQNTVRGQNMTDTRAKEAATLRKENRPPSSAERRVYSFYERANNAIGTLDELQDEMANKNWAEQGWQKWGPNVMQTENNQTFAQARRQFAEAYLRKDSGANISPSEWKSAEEIYFPVPGDGKKVLERKAAARRNLLNSLKRESGRAAEVAEGAPVVPEAPSENDDALLDRVLRGGK